MKFFKVFLFFFAFTFQIKSQQALDFNVGGGFDSPMAVTPVKASVDTVNNFSYVAGNFFWNTDFDFSFLGNFTLVNPYSLTAQQVFFAKYTNNGNLVWAKRIGNANSTTVTCITNDVAGNVYISALFKGILDVDAGNATYTLSAPTAQGAEDAFLVKYDPNGNFLWAKSMAGPSTQIITSLVADPVNNDIVIAGSYNGLTNIDVSASNFTLTSNSTSTNVFIATYNSLGNFIQASSANTSSGNASISDMELRGNLMYIVGNFTGMYDFDPSISTFNSSSTYQSGFIWSVNKNTGTFNYQKKIAQNGSGTCSPSSIAILNQKMYIGGWFEDIVDFDASPSTFTLNSGAVANQDAFTLSYNLNGNFLWVNKLESASANVNELCYDISVSKNGDLFSCGAFDGNGITDFNPSATASYTLMSFWGMDAYVTCTDTLGNFKNAYRFQTSTSHNQYCTSVFASSKEVFLMGQMDGNKINLMFSISTYNVPQGSFSASCFWAKYDNVKPPTANFSMPLVTTCISSCLSFTDTSIGTPNQWFWSFPGANPSSSLQKNPTNICYTTAGTYTISLLAVNGAGLSTFTDVITIIPPPSVTITPSSMVLCSGQSLTLTASGAQSYTWGAGSSTGSQLVTSLNSNTPISVTFFLTAMSTASCVSTATSQPIQVALCTDLSEKLLENNLITIYPNPSSDKTDFNANEIIESVTIYSAIGQQLVKLECNSTTGAIDLSKLSNGIYFVNFKQRNNSITKRIVKN